MKRGKSQGVLLKALLRYREPEAIRSGVCGTPVSVQHIYFALSSSAIIT